MASKHKEKDQAMAALMKKNNVRRSSARCPICNALISLSLLQSHIAFHRP